MTSQISATELRSFYAGLILSDGTIDKGVSKRAFALATVNEDFADYIIDFTKTYTNFEITKKYSPAKLDSKNVQHKQYWTVSIKANPYFAKLYHLFYDDYRKKYINPKVLNWLDYRGLANWYMSDGYCTNVGKTKGLVVGCRVEFCNDCFSFNDNQIFCNWLSNFGHKTKVIKRGSCYRSRMSLYDAQVFFVKISDFIVPSMRYKLFMNVERSWFTEDYKTLKSDILAQGLAFKS